MGELISISNELKSLGMRIAWLEVDNIIVRPSSATLLEKISEVIDDFKKRYKDLEELKTDPIVQAYRKTLWRLGIDPTKIRPSSEALARRVLRGKPLPRINNVVDSGNAASLYYLIPIGLYDLDRIAPPLVLERCREPCIFEPIGSEKRTLREGTPILRDARGYVVHVYPHRDAVKTRITENTKRVLALAAGVPGVDPERLARALELFTELLRRDIPSVKASRIRIV